MTAMVVLAAALIALGAIGLTRLQAASPGGAIGLVAVDTDTTGNTATSIGTVDECSIGSVGNPIDIDVIVNAVPTVASGGGVQGFGFVLTYDPAVVTVSALNNLMLVAAGGGTVPLDFSEGTPSSDGAFNVAFADFGANLEEGAGVLSRITLQGAGVGVSDLTLSLLSVNDQSNNVYTITTIAGGRVAIGASCATPTPSPTPSPVPTAAPTGTFTVNKDFSDVNAASVNVTVVCTNSATANPAGATAVSPDSPGR